MLFRFGAVSFRRLPSQQPPPFATWPQNLFGRGPAVSSPGALQSIRHAVDCLSARELFNPRPSTFCPKIGGFVSDSAKARSFVINQIGGFVFQKNAAFSDRPSACLDTPPPSAFCLLDSADRLPPTPSAPTVASFLVLVKARSFVVNQIGGFIFGWPLSWHATPPSSATAFCRPCAANAFPAPNGGFVPDSSKARSFVINQLGGFVFQKTLLSAIGLQLASTLLPLAYRPL